jgi:stage III sporulation protein AG
MIKLKENLIEKMKNPKVLITLGCVGILLIFLSSLPSKTQKETEKTLEEISVEEYRETLERDIKKIVKGITGDSKPTVVITLESGISYEYADITEGSLSDKSDKDTTVTSSQQKQGYITVKNKDGSEQALLVKAKMPEVRGVAIVCEGGDNSALAEKIQNTVIAALNITSKRVYIAGGT